MYTKRLVSVCVFAMLLFISLPGFGANRLSQTSRTSNRLQQLHQLREARASQLEQDRTRLGHHTQAAVGALTVSVDQLQDVTTLSAAGKIGFLSALQVPAGGDPSGTAATGDFNGDGKLDIAAAVYSTSSERVSVSVALGNGDGTFQAPKLTASGANDPYATVLVVADVNGDAKDDVLVFCPYATDLTAWNTEQRLEVFISNGNGTFATPVVYTLGVVDVVAAIAIDTNGDRVPDVMAVSSDGHVITMLNSGNGTFQPPVSVQYSGNLANALIADLDGDGKPDLAGFDMKSLTYEVYLAANGGGFQPPAQLPISFSSACSTVVGDLTGDGKPELVVSGCNYLANNVTIYKNNGNGTFDDGTSLWAGFYTYATTIADVNGDGKNDIVALNEGSGDISVLLGNGDGTVQPASPCSDGSCGKGGYAIGGSPFTRPAIADFNGDGKLDAVIADDRFSFTYLQGYGDGTFHAATNYYGSLPSDDSWPTSVALASADVNADSYPDVVVANSGSTTTGLTVFQNDKKGGLQPGITIAAGEFQYVAIGSFHGYFNADIAATSTPASAAHSVQVFLNNGNGTFQAAKSYPVDLADSSSMPQGVVAADLNGDSNDDLVIINLNSKISILLNDGHGAFLPPVTYAIPGGGYQLAVADIDKDGKLDIVAADFFNNTVDFLRGHGDGTFDAAQSVTVGASPDGIAVADFNGDHNPDIAVAHWDDNTIAVLTGTGDGTFNAPVYYAAGVQNSSTVLPNATELRIADVDGDGYSDLLWENSANGTVGVLYGDGQGDFAGPLEFPVAANPWGLVVADMNLDDAPDVVTSSRNMLGATVLLNAGGNLMQGTATPNPAQSGQTVALSATVNNSVKGVTAVPTGTVEFDLGSTVLGTINLVNGSASVNASSLAPGTYKAIARYSGDKSFRAKSISIPFTVDKLATTTTVVSSENPSMESSAVTFTATIAPAAATGSVTFKDGTTTLGAPIALDISGKASFTTSSLSPGTHSITAVYAGNATYSTSTSGALNQVITPLPGSTTTTLASSANPSVTGHSVTFTASVSSSNQGTISGTVTFKDGTTTLGTGTLDASGKATYSTSALAIGSHAVVAIYGGDANFTTSTSTTLAQVVNDLAATTTTLTSSANPAIAGNLATFTASVTSTTSGTITGTVTFKDGTTTLGTGTLDGSGKATFSTASLNAATHTITAVYAGDTNFAGSTSTALAQVVLASAPDYILTANPTTINITAGQTGTSTITASANEYFNGTVTLSCGALPAGVTCRFNPSSLTPTNGHPAQSTLTISTTAQTAALQVPASPSWPVQGTVVLASLSGITLLGGCFVGDFSRRKRQLLIALVALMSLVMLVGLSGCGGGGSSQPTNPGNLGGTPLGQSVIQISTTATAGTNGGNTSTHFLSLTINVSK